MKMTMHIDEAILEEVMETFGIETKTDAVNTALKEMVRKKKLMALAKTGLGLTKEELMDAFEPGYDPDDTTATFNKKVAMVTEDARGYRTMRKETDGETDPS